MVTGDLNGDGRVSLEDVILALQVLVGKNPLTIRTEYPVSGADVDSNNQIGLPEAIYILQKAGAIR